MVEKQAGLPLATPWGLRVIHPDFTWWHWGLGREDIYC